MRNFLWLGFVAALAAALAACGGDSAGPEKITVAAAANLTGTFQEVARAFETKTGIGVVLSFGPTAELAQQIENGGPFDVFASADRQHVDALAQKGVLKKESCAVYASGQLALWFPQANGERALKDLTAKNVRYVAVAQPNVAPYGKASVEALEHAGLWSIVEPRVVYAGSINAAKQMASSGNADAAFTAYSLVLHEKGVVTKIDPTLYTRLDQGLGIVAKSRKIEQAERFRSFLLGEYGQEILAANGYLTPKTK